MGFASTADREHSIVTQRSELLVGLFYLATLYCSLHYWDEVLITSKRFWLLLASLCCLAGMACKEVMVTAPVVVLLFERTFIAGPFLALSSFIFTLCGFGYRLATAAGINSTDRGQHLPDSIWKSRQSNGGSFNQKCCGCI